MGENICILTVPNRRKMNLDNKRTRWWLGRKGAGSERWKVGKQLTTTESQNERERQMERMEGSKRGGSSSMKGEKEGEKKDCSVVQYSEQHGCTNGRMPAHLGTCAECR